MTISTHVLDTARGVPAEGVPVVLERADGEGWAPVGNSSTDADGRVRNLVPEGSRLGTGWHRLIFDTGAYFRSAGLRAFYPEVSVVFVVEDDGHYHVPLLLNPFGYSTYRGS